MAETNVSLPLAIALSNGDERARPKPWRGAITPNSST